jgi:predicted RNA-binding protein YlxR (DUF448 family)
VSKRGHIPTRMCIGCRGRKRKEEMVRLTQDSNGFLRVSEQKNFSGRGVYLCPDRTCLMKAQKKKHLFQVYEVNSLPVSVEAAWCVLMKAVGKRRKGNGED